MLRHFSPISPRDCRLIPHVPEPYLFVVNNPSCVVLFSFIEPRSIRCPGAALGMAGGIISTVRAPLPADHANSVTATLLIALRLTDYWHRYSGIGEDKSHNL